MNFANHDNGQSRFLELADAILELASPNSEEGFLHWRAACAIFERHQKASQPGDPKLLRKWLLSLLRQPKSASTGPGTGDGRRSQVGRLTGSSVFLSYAREDEAVAERLRSDLESEGATVFQYSESATPGEPIWEEIYSKIDQSDAFLLLVTGHTARSDGVAAEVRRAHFRFSNNERPRRLIPLILKLGVDPPPLLQGLVAVPFRDYDAGLERLVRTLSGKAGDPLPDPPQYKGERARSPRRLWLIAAIGLAAFLAVWTIGLNAHVERMAYLRSQPVAPLTYPLYVSLLTSVDMMARLPIYALASLLGTHDAATIRIAGWILSALGLWGLCTPRLDRFPRWLNQAVVALLLVILTVSAAAYQLVLRAEDPTRPASSLAQCVQTGPEAPHKDWLSRRIVETCYWLTNESPRNDVRRQALGGLSLWFLLAAAGGVVANRKLLRRPAASKGSVTVVLMVAMLGLLTVLLLVVAPQSYAFAKWGLKYHEVEELRGSCPERRLEESLAGGRCLAFDVSEDANETAVLLWGEGCPATTEILTLSSGRQCFQRLSDERKVIPARMVPRDGDQ